MLDEASGLTSAPLLSTSPDTSVALPLLLLLLVLLLLLIFSLLSLSSLFSHHMLLFAQTQGNFYLLLKNQAATGCFFSRQRLFEPHENALWIQVPTIEQNLSESGIFQLRMYFSLGLNFSGSGWVGWLVTEAPQPRILETGGSLRERARETGRGQTSRTPGAAHPGKRLGNKTRGNREGGSCWKDLGGRLQDPGGDVKRFPTDGIVVVKLATTVSLPVTCHPPCHMVENNWGAFHCLIVWLNQLTI